MTSQKLFIWTVGDQYDQQQVCIIANDLNEARQKALEAYQSNKEIQCFGGYDVDLNGTTKYTSHNKTPMEDPFDESLALVPFERPPHGKHISVTNIDIIMNTTDEVVELTNCTMFAFQHGTG